MNMLNNNFYSIAICVIAIVTIVCITIMACCEMYYKNNNNSKEIDKLKIKIISIEEKLQK